MGTVPIPLARRRLDEVFEPGALQWGDQRSEWNSELRRLAARVLAGPYSEEESPQHVLQTTTTVYRRFQILAKNREEEIAQYQAEASFTNLCQRYSDQIRLDQHRALRELFLDEGLIGYVINGEIELLESTIILPDCMCLSYETISIPNQRPW